MESEIFGLWLLPDETCLGMYDCVLLISGYWTMWWRRNTERVRTVSLSRFTSVLAMFFVWLWVLGLCLVCVFLVWLFACVVVSWFSLVHHMLRHT